ncbi:MAG: hypothetical protein HQ523_13820 [Lentisphaerae bacterium]|nr:hypothetical protein [Lentisphaerota bacterium]
MLALIFDTDLKPWDAAIRHAAQVVLDELWEEITCLPRDAFNELSDEERGRFKAIISYTNQAPEGAPQTPVIHLRPSGFFGPEYGQGVVPDASGLALLNGTPVLYGDDAVEQSTRGISTGADLLASTYFLTTRFEELLRPDVRDNHGRFPGSESLPARAGFIHRPIVDEYAAQIRAWLQALGVALPARKRRFKLLLTHDVDLLGRYRLPFEPFRTLGSALLGRQSVKTAVECLAVHLGRRQDPMDTFDEMMALDGQVEAEVYYFFMAGGSSQWDGWYRIGWRRTKRLLRKLMDSGATIGLHASYEAGARPTSIADEKAALERACGCEIRHNRHHFLGWREMQDGHALAAAGINWDSTLGYAEVAGFRLGVCRPIPLFDPVELRPLGIEEHPLVLMECSLDQPHYMGLDLPGAEAYALGLLRETRKYGGEYVVLWHNSSFEKAEDNYLPALYRRLIDHLRAGEEAV